jgi:glycosyltransferase involved in cell wall biosynthesis
MAAGRPVVATRVGGVPDLVEHGVAGWLVEAGDVEGLAGAIGGLLADPEQRRRFGAAGRRRVFPTFGAARLVADMDRLYVRLLQEKLGGMPAPHAAAVGPPAA